MNLYVSYVTINLSCRFRDRKQRPVYKEKRKDLKFYVMAYYYTVRYTLCCSALRKRGIFNSRIQYIKCQREGKI